MLSNFSLQAFGSPATWLQTPVNQHSQLGMADAILFAGAPEWARAD
jgi:hypothetical protein